MKKKSPQAYLTAVILIAVTAFGLNIFQHQKSLLLIWLIGLAIGFVLYRSGFCFTTAYSNAVLFRDFSMVRAVLILLFVSLVGIYFIQFYAHLNGGIIPGKLHSVGIHTIAGGFLFGLGMILAGGCASGTLQRIGEGFLLFWFVLCGMVFGSVAGAGHFSWWVNNLYSWKPVFLPDVFGWAAGGIFSAAALGGIYYLTVTIEGPKTDKKIVRKPDVTLQEQLLRGHWPPWVGGILLGVLNVLLTAVYKPWGIAGDIADWGFRIWAVLGGHPELWDEYFREVGHCFLEKNPVYNGDTVLNTGLVVGVLLATALAGEFRFKRIKSGRQLILGLAGGVLMGYGARLALGCNVGALLGGIASQSLHGWVFGFFLIFGALTGLIIVQYCVTKTKQSSFTG